MNRKMRAKLNNQQAKAERDRKPCPQRGVVFTDQDTCDTCGAELLPIAVLVAEKLAPKETLH